MPASELHRWWPRVEEEEEGVGRLDVIVAAAIQM
jgi:hypothetical protein